MQHESYARKLVELAKLIVMQIARMNNCCLQVNVEIDVKKGKHVNRIRLHGNASDISRVVEEVTDIMNEAENEGRRKMEEELIGKQVLLFILVGLYRVFH